MTDAPAVREQRGMSEQIRIAGYFILACGVLLAIASLFADPLALGQPGTSFGWKQWLGTVTGLGMTIGGMRMTRRR